MTPVHLRDYASGKSFIYFIWLIDTQDCDARRPPILTGQNGHRPKPPQPKRPRGLLAQRSRWALNRDFPKWARLTTEAASERDIRFEHS